MLEMSNRNRSHWTPLPLPQQRQMSATPWCAEVGGSDLDGPDGLLQRVEELEAEAVLLGGPLDELAGIEQHRSNPLAIFVGLVDEQHARLQHTPQLGPALQSATDLCHREKRFAKARPRDSSLQSRNQQNQL